MTFTNTQPSSPAHQHGEQDRVRQATIRAVVTRALEREHGHAVDNLYRAQASFKHRTPEQMQEQWGRSGATCQEILDAYQRRVDEIAMAIEEFA